MIIQVNNYNAMYMEAIMEHHNLRHCIADLEAKPGFWMRVPDEVIVPEILDAEGVDFEIVITASETSRIEKGIAAMRDRFASITIDTSGFTKVMEKLSATASSIDWGKIYDVENKR